MIPWTSIEHEDMGAWEVLSLFVTRDTVLPVLRALDSLETIDSERIAVLVEYFSDYADYLLVALLPEDAAALNDGHQRITGTDTSL